jgi:hypothetical protein
MISIGNIDRYDLQHKSIDRNQHLHILSLFCKGLDSLLHEVYSAEENRPPQGGAKTHWSKLSPTLDLLCRDFDATEGRVRQKGSIVIDSSKVAGGSIKSTL